MVVEMWERDKVEKMLEVDRAEQAVGVYTRAYVLPGIVKGWWAGQRDAGFAQGYLDGHLC